VFSQRKSIPADISRWSWSYVKRILTRLLFLGIAAALAIVVINAAVLWTGRARMVAAESAQPAQAVIVLGALVFPDGTVSEMVADRLETAYGLYAAGKAKKILITGDHGTLNYDEVNTMRRYLERKGVPTEDIFMDHAGFDTYNSMYRARDVFQVHSAIIVTQRFHLPRAVYIARKLGLDVQGVAADRHVYVGAGYYEVRELGARLKAFGEVVTGKLPVYLGPVIPITGDGRATHDQPK
jgi:SanA protein